MTATPADADSIPLPCPYCGYDLRGSQSSVCPECGEAFDADALATTAAIPWQDRREIGRLRAFRRTVWMAVRRPGELARQATRPVDYADARRFQLFCVTLAWLAVAPPAAWGLWQGLRTTALTGNAPWTLSGQLADGAVVLAAVVGSFFWLLTASGVAGYFFHRRDQPAELQDRAVALSYYSVAPLAFMPVAVALLAAFIASGMAADRISGSSQPNNNPVFLGLILALAAAAAAAGLLILLDLLILPLKLLSLGTHASAGRLIACGVTVAAGWLLLFAVFAVGLPALTFYAELVWVVLT